MKNYEVLEFGEEFDNIDGTVIPYKAVLGSTPISNRYKEEFENAEGAEDDDDFYGADGDKALPIDTTDGDDYYGADGSDDDDDYYGAEGDDEDEYYNAGGWKRFWKNARKNQKIRQKRRNLRASSKADARRTKADAKNTLAKSQVISAKALGGSAGADAELAKALQTNNVEEPKPQGMSKGLKIGLIVGGVVILGIIGLVIYKSSKGKK